MADDPFTNLNYLERVMVSQRTGGPLDKAKQAEDLGYQLDPISGNYHFAPSGGSNRQSSTMVLHNRGYTLNDVDNSKNVNNRPLNLEGNIGTDIIFLFTICAITGGLALLIPKLISVFLS